MNYSALKDKAGFYLGFHGIQPDETLDALIDECIREVERIAQFRYWYATFTRPLAFLQREPYTTYLAGATGYMLVATTLGLAPEQRVKYLSVGDMTKSAVTDAVANAMLEQMADGYERALGDDLSYRFCPGYQGSSASDVRYILEALTPQKVDVRLLDSGFMLPQKSMAGIVAIGGRAQKKCGDCIMATTCAFRKEGKRCFDSASK